MTSGPTSGIKAPDAVVDVGDLLMPKGGRPRQDKAYSIIVAVREQDGKRQFLMVRHRERGWELPGGKLEGGEGPVHCALREFREETGHLVSQPRFVLKLPRANGTCFVFTGGLGARVSQVDAQEAIEEMDWFDRLPPREQLAFPDDPYDAIGQAIGIGFHG